MIRKMIIIYIIILLLKKLKLKYTVKKFLVWPISNRIKGRKGEKKVHKTLNKITKKLDNCTLVSDILIKDNNTTQIDHVLFLDNTVYVIETKKLFRNLRSKCSLKRSIFVLPWKNGRFEQKVIHNPYEQNRGHIHELKKFIDYRFPGNNFRYVNILFVPGDTSTSVSGLGEGKKITLLKTEKGSIACLWPKNIIAKTHRLILKM